MNVFFSFEIIGLVRQTQMQYRRKLKLCTTQVEVFLHKQTCFCFLFTYFTKRARSFTWKVLSFIEWSVLLDSIFLVIRNGGLVYLAMGALLDSLGWALESQL